VRRTAAWSSIFALVVVLLLGQVTWWTWFQLREASRLESAGAHLRGGDVGAALAVLEAASPEEVAERARRHRTMFLSEGIALSLLVLAGVAWMFVTLMRERRLQELHQRFLTGATHELKTPLTTLRLGLESLASGRLPTDRQPSYVEAMLAQVERLERDVGNLLAAAGLERGDRALQLAPGDLADDVRSALDGMRDRIQTAEVEVVADLQSAAAARDPAALRVVLNNLLDNALKFTPRGGRVRVGVRPLGARAEVSVSDDGEGIPADELGRVFERFYTGSAATHRGGTGLGLHLSLELVRMQHGTLIAQSEGKGQGSTFVLTLPGGDGRR
jgi:two-component system phosphate regulon sensor histidine kinase PhoR